MLVILKHFPQQCCGRFTLGWIGVRRLKKASEIAKQMKLVPDDAAAPEPLKPEIISPEESPDILFQHTVFCQTSFPYDDPGDDVRLWERQNGRVHLTLQAGTAYNPFTENSVEVGLPFGPKARLLLAYLNTTAIQTKKAEIQTARSFTAFLEQMGLGTYGRNITVAKHQLTRLTSAFLSLACCDGGRVEEFKTPLVETRSLWYEKGANGRVWWPGRFVLASRYFESLQTHAVPLKQETLMYLAQSAMALDIYAWLAQRLHRINPRKPMFVPWDVLYRQFGGTGYSRQRKFKEFFIGQLADVLTQYKEAKVEMSRETGLTLRNSLPPVRSTRILLVQ
jgi:hypothetical protein